jgi:protein-S-isoprenylcysteine O-methyltransferase Ste14
LHKAHIRDQKRDLEKRGQGRRKIKPRAIGSFAPGEISVKDNGPNGSSTFFRGGIVRALELKVPPPVVILLSGALMWLVKRAVPSWDFGLPGRVILAVLLIAGGLATGSMGVRIFRRAKTTTNPLKPESASSLVDWGIYAITRNPMYLGGLVMLTGWAIFVSNALAFVFLPLYVLYINRFQIAPEERILKSLFGQEYAAYQARVRRCL